jgi:hypothetical protein
VNERRALRWLRRYGPAELIALFGALAGYVLLEAATASHVAAAYGAALGDNLGYYGYIVAREIRAKVAGRPHRVRGALRVCRGLALEFGPAELLDSTIVRPACVAVATSAFGMALGVLVAKVAADLVFYVPVITTFELQGRYSARKAAAGAAPVRSRPRSPA